MIWGVNPCRVGGL